MPPAPLRRLPRPLPKPAPIASVLKARRLVKRGLHNVMQPTDMLRIVLLVVVLQQKKQFRQIKVFVVPSLHAVRLLRLVPVGNPKPPCKLFHPPNGQVRPLLPVVVLPHVALVLPFVRHGKRGMVYHNGPVVLHLRPAVRHY